MSDFLYFSDIMPRSSKNLELYKTEIISLFQNNDNFYNSIASILQNKYNIQITRHTIASHLKEWEIQKWNHTTTFNTILYTQIKILFFEIDLEDDNMLHTLQDEKFEITSQTLAKLQLWLGLQHCTNSIEAQ